MSTTGIDFPRFKGEGKGWTRVATMPGGAAPCQRKFLDLKPRNLGGLNDCGCWGIVGIGERTCSVQVPRARFVQE